MKELELSEVEFNPQQRVDDFKNLEPEFWKHKKLDELNDLIKLYKDKLPVSEQKKLETKLNEIKSASEYFGKKQTASRLDNQEKVMSNLEKDFYAKTKTYFGDMWHGKGKRKETFQKNMTFWAEDMLMPERNKLEQNGIKVVDKIMGDGKAQKGTYHEIMEILEPHISKE